MARKKPGSSSKRGAKGAEHKRQVKDEVFFRELATLCNVTAALRVAGMVRQSGQVYERRRRDPEYRARWEEAIGESYAMLELEMLARSRHGEDRPAPATEAEKKLRELSDRQALNLLRMHKSQVKGRVPHAQRPLRGEKLRDALEKRLSEISRRLGGGG